MAGSVRGRVVDEDGNPIAGAEVRWSVATPRGSAPPARFAVPQGADLATLADLGDLAALGAATGGLLGVTAGPVPPIPLHAGEGGGSSGGATTTALATVTSDARGEFRMSGLRPGAGRLLVRAPDDAFAPGASGVLELAPGGVLESTVRLERGGILAVRVVDEAGFPLASAPVEVKVTRELESRLGVTDAHGEVHFSGVRGSAEVAARVVGALLGTGTPIAGHASVAAGATEELELVVPDAFGRVAGQVLDPEGRPVAGARLHLEAGADTSAFRSQTLSGLDGRFVLPGLPEPPWTLRVTAEDWLPQELTLVESLEDLRIDLVRGALLETRVVDAWLNGPAVGARARLTPLDGDATALAALEGTSARDGELRLGPVPPGRFRLRVELLGRVAATRELRVEPGARRVTLPTIALDAAGTLRGEVVDTYGEAAVGARVRLAGEAGAHEDAVADAAGRFEFTGLNPGNVSVSASHPEGGRGDSGRVRVELAGTTSVRVVLDGRMPTRASETVAANEGSSAGESAEPPEGGDRFPEGGIDARVERRGSAVVVTEVGPNARRSGLRRGDTVVTIDGETMYSEAQVRALFRGGRALAVVIRRGRTSRTLRLRPR